TFSDIANGVARDYGFWLDDAFASGGSAGYDHKKMAITARGAWESVKRHFREMGLDTQQEPFGVVGIGDMSGDVFGNGMLLSPHIKLHAAFNHLHIFLDPDPDPAASFAERKRMFEMPRSSWTDYDASLISSGGGLFERTAKSIQLSSEIQARLGIEAESLTPNQLINAILKAPVDLLWNGGIGTYVKAKSETHADAGDRANDAVRIDAVELRCRVVGEGGNLGLTQLSRIEAAQAGIRINSDAIDNSAGVDCSDHEVNIKVLLGDVVSAGDMTLKQRNALLIEMTDEVAEQCLQDNYLQTQGISVIEAQGAAQLEVQIRLMQSLERSGRLNRAVEFLPDAEALDQRRAARQGLTRPEISVLYAYVKNALYDDLLASDLPDDPSLETDLLDYFPRQLREQYPERILGHKLRREIVSTRVANSLVNRASMVFPMLAEQETGRGAADVARAYVVACDVLGLNALWQDIESHDNRVTSACQTDMIYATRELMEHIVLWFLRQRPHPLDAEGVIASFGAGVRAIRGTLPTVLKDQVRESMEAEAAKLHEQGVDEGLARAISGIPHLFAVCDIVDVANRQSIDVIDAAGTYYRLGARLGLDWLRARAREVKAETHWQRQAVTAIVDELYGQQRAITGRVAEVAGGGSEAVERWMGENADRLSRSTHMLSELRSADMVDLAMLAVANREIRALTDE
ncbi:MAG: NAD-glutamate dehydrogenase domain-containing protein, partial [Alphaproteobacteria bacterium]